MELEDFTKPAFASNNSMGLTKMEYVAAMIYAHGDLDANESAKAAITILQACDDVLKGMIELRRVRAAEGVNLGSGTLS